MDEVSQFLYDQRNGAEGNLMATSRWRLSLFWHVHTSTSNAMMAGAFAWFLAGEAAKAVEVEPHFRSTAGMLILFAVFIVIELLISMVTFGALLRHYSVTPIPDDNPPKPPAASGRVT
jgi:hypothetical protein